MKRATAVAAVVGVFLSGALVGALALRLVSSARHPGFDRPPMHPFGPDLARRLDLDPEQAARVETILDRHRREMEALRERTLPRVRGMLRDTEREIGAVLDPAQRERFEAILERHDRWRHRLRHRERPGPPDEPPPADG